MTQKLAENLVDSSFWAEEEILEILEVTGGGAWLGSGGAWRKAAARGDLQMAREPHALLRLADRKLPITPRVAVYTHSPENRSPRCAPFFLSLSLSFSDLFA